MAPRQWVQAIAEVLPFRARRFDAATALWTVRHWTDLAQGLAELRRVARRVVIVTPSVLLNRLWLTSDYFPAMAAARRPEARP